MFLSNKVVKSYVGFEYLLISLDHVVSQSKLRQAGQLAPMGVPQKLMIYLVGLPILIHSANEW